MNSLYMTCIFLMQLPILFEIILQIRLQALLLTELPPSVRANLPPFPKGAKTILFTSIQFQSAFWNYLSTENSDDSPEAIDLKKRLRNSLRRKLVFFLIDFAALVYLGFWFFR